MTTPDETLHLFASVIRTRRAAKGWSQTKLASEAGVSLAQVSLLERGSNVSVVFLSKVARALELTLFLADGTEQMAEGTAHLDVFELIRKTDLLALLVDDLRAFATNSVLPSTGQGKLKDTPLVEEFLDRVLADERGVQRLAEAMLNLSSEAQVPTLAKAPSGLTHTRKSVKGKG